MPTAIVTYLGSLRTEAEHMASGNKIITDAPVDNMGKGAAFSPTDLASTSLASCMLTTMGIAAQTHNINMDGAYAEVIKTMANDPRRIAKVEVDIHMPELPFSPKEKTILEKAAHACPVSRSLSPNLEEVLHFHWKH